MTFVFVAWHSRNIATRARLVHHVARQITPLETVTKAIEMIYVRRLNRDAEARMFYPWNARTADVNSDVLNAEHTNGVHGLKWARRVPISKICLLVLIKDYANDNPGFCFII